MIYIVMVNQPKEEGGSAMIIKHNGKKSAVHALAEAEYRRTFHLKSSVALFSRTVDTYDDSQEDLARQVFEIAANNDRSRNDHPLEGEG